MRLADVMYPYDFGDKPTLGHDPSARVWILQLKAIDITSTKEEVRKRVFDLVEELREIERILDSR